MRILSSILASFLITLLLSSAVSARAAKVLIVDEGQAKLMQEVNAGQKSNQLTLKEANKLRKELAHIARKKAKMLAKSSNSKLSAEETAELKSDVNKISVEIHKLELEKRLQVR